MRAALALGALLLALAAAPAGAATPVGTTGTGERVCLLLGGQDGFCVWVPLAR